MGDPLAALGAGIVAGLGVAVPLGPIGILILETALRRGWGHGAAAGMGAAGQRRAEEFSWERVTAKVDDYVKGKTDKAGKAGKQNDVEALAQKILAAIEKEPLYYTDIAERFSEYDFNTVARALGYLHQTEKLWQDPRGKMCVRGSKFAAVLPVKKLATLASRTTQAAGLARRNVIGTKYP